MKNIDAVQLYLFLMSDGSSLKMNFKTRLAMKKNISILEPFYRRLVEVEAEKNSLVPELKDFEAELILAGSDCLEKDKEGKISYQGDRLKVLPGKMEEIQSIRLKLLEDHPEWNSAVIEKEEKEREWADLLNSDIDFELTKFNVSGFEDLKLDNKAWSLLELLLEEEG